MKVMCNKWRFDIPDLVIVDLYSYPLRKRLLQEQVKLILKNWCWWNLTNGAAAKLQDTIIIASVDEYTTFDLITEQNGSTTLADRKLLATKAFHVSSLIHLFFNYFNTDETIFKASVANGQIFEDMAKTRIKRLFLRILTRCLKTTRKRIITWCRCCSKLINNLSWWTYFCHLKHNNACGLATRNSISEALPPH
jgi:phosphoribosylaminoimidazolecarboxamide formyltransferase/IMP cyclohydrolase